MKKIILLVALAAGTWAAFVASGFDRKIEIKFDEARDGPIYFETVREGLAKIQPGAPGMCLTSMPVNGGSSGIPVYTTCSMTSNTTSTAFITTTGGTIVSR